MSAFSTKREKVSSICVIKESVINAGYARVSKNILIMGTNKLLLEGFTKTELNSASVGDCELRKNIEMYKRTSDEMYYEKIKQALETKILWLAKKNCLLTTSLEIDDLIQIGYICLWEGLQSFDDSKAETVWGYFSFIIERRIWREINNRGFSIDIPVAIRDKIRKLRKITRDFDRKYMQENSDFICENMGMDTSEIQELLYLSLYMQSSSLDESASKGMEIRSEFNLDNEVWQKLQCNEFFQKLPAPLTTKERRVVILRYGILDGEPRSMEQVGQEMGVTKQAIAKIEKNALKKLANSSVAEQLRDMIQSKEAEKENKKKSIRPPCE